MLGASDYVIANGGTTVLTEVPEMFGAERILMSHCRDEATFEKKKTVTMVNDFKQYFIALATSRFMRTRRRVTKPGGITTLEEKSLGCTQKAGANPVVDVLRYGERLKTHGLESPEAPGERCGCHQRAGRCRLPHGAVQHRPRYAVRRVCPDGQNCHQQ